MKLILNILGAAVIIAVLALVIVPTVPHCGPSLETSLTKHEMGQIYTALQLYHREYGRLPAETDNVMVVRALAGDNPKKLKFYLLDRKKSKTGEFSDGWGNLYYSNPPSAAPSCVPPGRTVFTIPRTM